MPVAESADVSIHWQDSGHERPALVLLNSIGTDLTLWDGVLALLPAAWRVIRIDTRGHGKSGVPEGDYSLSTLAADVCAVLDAAEVDSAVVAGVSLGGMMAMELALLHPERVDGLALVCTSASVDAPAWAERVEAVRKRGTAAVVDLTMGRFLSPAFASAHPRVERRIRHGLQTMAPAGYAGAAAAIRDMTLRERVHRVSVPTVVVTGSEDVSTPLRGHGDVLLARIPDAQWVEVDAAHLAPVEAPRAVAEALCQLRARVHGGRGPRPGRHRR
jgi:3-oxoadipate enol-lactonase